MIEIEDLSKSFGEKQVLRGIDLSIASGETFGVIGQSGCGKSVLLKHIIGLLEPDQGAVSIDGRNINTLHINEMYKLRLRFGYLFQGAALFDSMSVGENVALGIVENDIMDAAEAKTVVAEKLEMVGLPGIEDLKPSELSGGMKKRVGLARALATNPEYLLYDEPTTGLDPVMSNQIDSLIASLAVRLKVTSIVVTHDMFSIYKIVHRVAMIHKGKVQFIGTPGELQESPDPVVRDFLDRYGNSGDTKCESV